MHTPGRGAVAAIVVNWNGAQETVSCLASLAALNGAPVQAYVVDNASTDGSPGTIQRAHPDARLLTAPRNLGYAGAFNLGCAAALANGAAFVWLLNNDVLVNPDVLDAMRDVESRYGPAIISPKILYQDDPATIWYAGGYFDRRFKSHHAGKGEPDDGRFDTIRPLPWASGCSLFCSAETVRRIGPMDESYFLYLEDVDWCCSARRRGVPVYYAPGARVYHGVSVSVRRLDPHHLTYYAWRNYYRLVRRHGSPGHRLLAAGDLLSRFAKTAVRLAFFPSFRRDPHYAARTRALIDAARGHYGPMRAAATSRPAAATAGVRP